AGCRKAARAGARAPGKPAGGSSRVVAGPGQAQRPGRAPAAGSLRIAAHPRAPARAGAEPAPRRPPPARTPSAPRSSTLSPCSPPPTSPVELSGPPASEPVQPESTRRTSHTILIDRITGILDRFGTTGKVARRAGCCLHLGVP